MLFNASTHATVWAWGVLFYPDIFLAEFVGLSNMRSMIDYHKFSVAPMMDWTDRHCRMFHRMLSSNALLYTEMVVADAVIHGDRDRLVGFNEREQPVVVQVGGSNPENLAEACKILQDYNYMEINLNVGCPSDRVQSGRFGACLMAEAELVAECFLAMQNAVSIPVTVKCRLGIDEQDPYESLPDFIKTVKNAGCKTFIIHARKAWLKGLSPKENRQIPPLDYDLVRQVKANNPELTIILNGGLETLEQACSEIQNLDGVMFGRAAYNNPWLLSMVDERFYGAPAFAKTREDIIRELIEYTQSVEGEDQSVKSLTRHIMGLYHGQKGAKHWRRALSEPLGRQKPSEKIEKALSSMLKAKEKAA